MGKKLVRPSGTSDAVWELKKQKHIAKYGDDAIIVESDHDTTNSMVDNADNDNNVADNDNTVGNSADNDNKDSTSDSSNSSRENVSRPADLKKDSKNTMIAVAATSVVATIIAGAVGIGAYNHFTKDDDVPTNEDLEASAKAFQDAQYKGKNPTLVSNGVDPDSGKNYPSVPGVPDSEGGFVFASEDGPGENDTVVDVYMSFTGGKSTNLFINSLDAFKGAVSEGKFTLVVHPVFTESESSRVMPEGLAIVAHDRPNMAWKMFEQMLTLGNVRYLNNYDDSLTKTSVANTMQDMGIQGANEGMLNAKKYEKLFMSSQEEVGKKTGSYVPSVYVNGKKLDEKKTNFLNTNELFKAIDELSAVA